MIGPQIMGAMQNLERGHKDLKEMALRCASRAKIWARVLLLLAVIFAANKFYPVPVDVPKTKHARDEYDAVKHAGTCRR